uniref:Uncharacterized protein n=1 Tax=Aegilops tauschii TaxID=37682 RepID=N1QYY0_AEGTA
MGPRQARVKRTTNVRSRRDFVKLPTVERSSGYRAMNSGPNSASRSEMTGEQDYAVGENDDDFVTMFRARTGYRIVEPAHMVT